jgi:hypothetical protein
MNPTYLPYDSATNKLPVLLEGKIVGHIRAHAWGWWYVPVGLTQGGDTFKDIAAIKQSLACCARIVNSVYNVNDGDEVVVSAGTPNA